MNFEAAYLSSLLYLPVERVNVDQVRDDCTWEFTREEETKVTRVYDEDTYGGYIGVPLAYGFETWEGQIVDRTTRGTRQIFPQCPTPRDADQETFMRRLLERLRQDMTCVGIAPPGSGKTVSALWLTYHLQCNALVVVHTKRLLEQWIDRAQEHLGLSREQIGVWSGDRCEYGKFFVVGTIQSIMKGPRRYSPLAYESFGHVIWDEVHKVNATMFSTTLKLFTATNRTALTATWERPDGMHRAAAAYFGTSHVHSEQEAMPLRLFIHSYVSRRPVWGQNHGSRVKCLTTDPDRSEKLTNLIRSLYDNGRTVLVVGDNISHLESLNKAVVAAGVPDQVIGQYTAQWDDGVRRVATDQQYLAWCEEHAQVIFATYAMMKEGIDIPRLDAGVEATPRSSGVQVMGRVRRMLAGKRTPQWHIIEDKRFSAFKRYLSKRLEECRLDHGITIRRV